MLLARAAPSLAFPSEDLSSVVEASRPASNSVWSPLVTHRQPIAGGSFTPQRGDLGDCDRPDAPGDFLKSLRQRKRRWLKRPRYLARHGLWQAALNDKLLGYVYARSVGVATPAVLFCSADGFAALPARWPEHWGCCFVIKPLVGCLAPIQPHPPATPTRQLSSCALSQPLAASCAGTATWGS